jgi:ABC-type transport system involved in multi-copper enzyme maturation permease subunit
MNNTIFAVAKNTFRETIRDRILLSALAVIIFIILFTLFIGSISLDQTTRVITNFSVTAIYLLQVFVAIFIGSMLMYKEIERKTFYLIFPKPVTRTQIVLGKCLGLTATTLMVTLICTTFLFGLLALKGGTALFVPIIISILLSSVEAMLLILISLLFSSFTSPILAAVATTTLYFVGHASDIFRYIFKTTQSPSIEAVTSAIYYALPNLEKFNVRNDIVYNTLPSLQTISTSLIYAVIYGAFILYLTHLVIKKRDL